MKSSGEQEASLRMCFISKPRGCVEDVSPACRLSFVGTWGIRASFS